jgi:CheY-like chemotaxis protein
VAKDDNKGLRGLRPSRSLLPEIFKPGMGGFDTMRRIAKRQPDLRIMISGRPHTPNLFQEPDYLTMALELGAMSSLPEPFKSAQSLTMVADCLASASQSAPSRPDRDALPNS